MQLKLDKYLLSFLLIVSTGISTSQAQVSGDSQDEGDKIKTISLTQAIKTALANNTDIRSAMLSVEEADQQVRTAWSQVVPEVSASANYTRNIEVPVNFIPEVVFDPQGDPDKLVPVAFGTDNNWQGGLTISQIIFNGQAFVGVSSSSLYKAAQTEGLRATAQGVVTGVRMAYYQVLIAKEQVRLQQSRLKRVQENLEDTRKRYEQGLVDDYAIMQLEVQVENIKPELTSARFAEREAKRNLLDVMGLPVSLSIDVEGSLNDFDIRSESIGNEENRSLKEVDMMTPLRMESHAALLQQAYDYRGDLRVLDVQEQLQDKQVRAEISKYLPTVTASYNLQWTAAQSGQPVFFGTEDIRARSQMVMIGVQVPIFQGFRRDAAIQQAKIQRKNVRLQQRQTKRKAESEIISAEENIREAFQVEAARKRAVEQARRGYDRALKRYQNGMGSQQEVTDAELQLREAEIGYAQTVFSYLSAKAQYDQAIGLVPFVNEDGEELK